MGFSMANVITRWLFNDTIWPLLGSSVIGDSKFGGDLRKPKGG